MKLSAATYVKLIQASVNQILEYLPTNREEFLDRLLIQDAVLMRLQVIGENLAHIRALDEESFHEQAPVAWHELIGLRNIISHAYDDIRMEEIWTFIQRGELADLAETVATMDPRTGLPVADC